MIRYRYRYVCSLPMPVVSHSSGHPASALEFVVEHHNDEKLEHVDTKTVRWPCDL